MTTFNIKSVDSFPEIKRAGRMSAELQKIIDCLIESSKTGKGYEIENVEAGKKFNSLQQRIRSQAKKLNFKVTIHYNSATSSLFFKVPSVINQKTEKPVVAKDVKSVKTTAKANS
jgi:hypothetical protein